MLNVHNSQPDDPLAHEAVGNALRSRWGNVAIRDIGDTSDSDSDEELPYPVLEDDEPEPGYVDWAAIEANSGLSAWNQLGEAYERDAAAIGKN